MTTLELLRARLSSLLSPSYLEIIDDSQQHIGHAGNSGGGYFMLIIAAKKLDALSKLEGHRLIYAAIGDLIPEKIHALAIQLKQTSTLD